MDQPRFDEMIRRFLEGLPPSLQAAGDELKTHAERALRAGFNHLELVGREEFDAQARVLERSRELIEALEKRVAELEARLKN